MERRPTDEELLAWHQAGTSGLGIVTGRTDCDDGRGIEMFESEGRAVREGDFEEFLGHIAEAGLAEVWERIAAGYHTAAGRAAKTLALEQTLVALYVYACQRCGHVQDHEPEHYCGMVRSSLAVTRPGRMLPHLAPPPTGRSCPSWMGVNVASQPPSPPGAAGHAQRQ